MTPVKRFTSRRLAIGRIWKAVQTTLVSGEHWGEVAPAARQAAPKPTRKQHAHTGRKNTKQAQVVALLKRSGGATLQHLMRATGWQAHSVQKSKNAPHGNSKPSSGWENPRDARSGAA